MFYVSYAKYDTYKGSTHHRLQQGTCMQKMGTMILIKDRHTMAIARLIAKSSWEL